MNAANTDGVDGLSKAEGKAALEALVADGTLTEDQAEEAGDALKECAKWHKRQAGAALARGKPQLTADHINTCIAEVQTQCAAADTTALAHIKSKVKSKEAPDWCARPPKPEEVNTIFDGIDGSYDPATHSVTPGDGKITWAEAETAFGHWEAHALAEGWYTQAELDAQYAEMEEGFNECDADGKGSVDRAEFNACVQAGWQEECGAGASVLARLFSKRR